MTLINTQGMAFIGPGSEWFWTAISGLVLGITFVAIYRQLRVQRDAAAIDQLNGLITEWSSERLARAKLALLLALDAGVEAENLPDRAAATIDFFWQRVGFLVRTGHMDRELVYQALGDQVQQWRLWLAGRIRSDFVWIADLAAAMDKQRGVDHGLDPEELRAALPEFIQHFRDAVELEEALRTVTVRLTPTPIPTTIVARLPASADIQQS